MLLGITWFAPSCSCK